VLAPHTETTEAEQAATGQGARATGGRTFI